MITNIDAPAQDFKSEKELKKEAGKLFENGDYIEAYPLFSQLLSLYPNDIDYNYKFSVCILFADQDKEKALNYLKDVSGKPNCDKKAFYYLGRAYHLNYRFKEAIQTYQKFKKNVSKKEILELGVDRDIEMCNNGLKLLRKKTDLLVLEKTEIKEGDYFRSYDARLFKGKLLVKPDDFKSEMDMEMEERSIIFLGKNASVIYYSSYGVNGDNKDIYKVDKLPDGDWSRPLRLSNVINTQYDEDYPFMHPDGNVLYFCSKGHNSMGGYDIFKSIYDSTTYSWSEPVNLDFAINSTDDDILFLTNIDEKIACFSSKRTSVKGMITVYKVKLERLPGIKEVFAVSEEPDISDTSPTGTEESELLALDEIKEAAELNVNATEEDLAIVAELEKEKPYIEPGVKSEYTEPKYDTETPGLREVETETYTNFSNEQIINTAYENAKLVQKKSEELKQQADIAYSIADDKMKISADKAKEAEEILSTIESISDENQKQKEIEKAENLKAESEQATKETEAAYNLGETLETNADIKRVEAKTALSKAEEIERSVKSNSVEESIVMLIEQKVFVENSNEQTTGIEQAISDINKQAEQKQIESDQSYEKIQYIESESAEIKNDIVAFKKQAEETKDTQIKQEIIRQAEELEQELEENEREIVITYEKAKQLETEASDLQKEAELVHEVSNKIKESPELSSKAAEKEEEPELAYASDRSRTEPDEEKTIELPVTITEEISDTDPKTRDEEPETKVEKQVQRDEKQVQRDEEQLISDPETTTTTYAEETAKEEDFEESEESPPMMSKTKSRETPLIIDETDIETYSGTEIEDEIYQAARLEEEAQNYAKEAQSIREKAETLDDPYFKEKALKEAEKFEQSAQQKEIAAAESHATINKYKYEENIKELSRVKPDTYTEQSQEVVYVQELETESENLFEQAKLVRENAHSIDNTKTQKEELQKANDLEFKAVEKQKEAINKYQYEENKSELSLVSSNRIVEQYQETESPGKSSKKQETPPEIEQYNEQIANVQTLGSESEDLFEQARSARENAETIDDSKTQKQELQKAKELETKAIEKQKEAISTYKYEKNKLVLSRVSSSVEEKQPEKGKDSPKSLKKEETPSETQQQSEQINYGKSLETESESLFDQALSIRENAKTIDDPKTHKQELQKADNLEIKAIEKQKEAVTIYLESLPEEEQLVLADITEEILQETTEEPVTYPTTDTEEVYAYKEKEKPDEEKIITEESTVSDMTPTNREEYKTPEEDSEEITRKAPAESKKSEELRKESENQRETVQALLEKMDTISDPAILLETLDKVEEFEKMADINEAKADSIESLYVGAEDTKALAISEDSESETYSPELEKKTEMREIEDQSPQYYRDNIPAGREEPTYRSETETARISKPFEPEPQVDIKAPPPLINDVFETPSVPVYTKSNPIPVDKNLPGGLLYKVQIGAFRNPIPQDLFKELSPLMGENTPMGFIRYTAGMFKTLKSANEAKKTIRGFGYKDAFVVTYYNGNRITSKQAMALAGEGTADLTSLIEYTSSSSTGNEATGVTGTSSAQTTDLKNIKELLYTVQIGVYSKPVTSAQLHNLNPLYTSISPEGYIRYSYRIFDDLSVASSSKNTVVNKGITDAFVTAYYNGKRISIEQAKALKTSGSSEIFVSSPIEPEEKYSTPETTPKIDELENLYSDLTYKVQIGKFKDEVPVEKASLFLDIQNLGIERNTDESGFSIYTVGSFIDYNSAEELKNTVVKKGLKEAFVIAYSGNKIIPIEDVIRYKLEREEKGTTLIEKPESEAFATNEAAERKAEEERLANETAGRKTEEERLANEAVEKKVEKERIAGEKAKAEAEAKAREEARLLAAKESKEKAIAEVERLIEEITQSYDNVEMLQKSAKAKINEAKSQLSIIESEFNATEKKLINETQILFSTDNAEEKLITVIKGEEGFFRFEYLPHEKIKLNLFNKENDSLMIAMQNQEGFFKFEYLPFDEVNIYLLDKYWDELNIKFDDKETRLSSKNLSPDILDMLWLYLKVKENKIQTAEKSIQQALIEHQQAKTTYEQVQNLELTMNEILSSSDFSEQERENYSRLISSLHYDESLFPTMSEAELNALQMEVKKKYSEAEEYQNNTRIKTENAHALLENAETFDDQTIKFLEQVLKDIEQTKHQYNTAENLLYESKYKALLAGNIKEFVDDHLFATSNYDHSLLKRMSESEVKELLQYIQNKYNEIATLQNDVRSHVEEANTLCYTLNDEEHDKYAKEKELTKIAELMEQAKTKDQQAKNNFVLAQKLKQIAQYKMLLGGLSTTKVNNYINSIETVSYKPNLISTLSEAEAKEMQQEIREDYTSAETLQNSVRNKLDEARNILYSIKIIDEETIALLDDALWKVELVNFAYQDIEFKLFDSKCKMLLGAFSKDYVDNYLIATSSYDENLLIKLSKSEIDDFLGQVRIAFNNVIKLEDAAQAKIDEGKSIIMNAEKIEYPDVKEKEIIRGKELKTQGILEMEQVTTAEKVFDNIYLINKYKLLFGGITEEDADFQRLEYIPQ
ncbi:MAG: hypothetical protein ABII90_04090 [Bacteroidota bacterium]